MAVVVGMLITLGDYGVPVVGDWIPTDFIQVQLGSSPRDVQDKIHASFPFQETELGLQVNEGKSQDFVVENRTVNSMDVEKVELDGL